MFFLFFLKMAIILLPTTIVTTRFLVVRALEVYMNNPISGLEGSKETELTCFYTLIDVMNITKVEIKSKLKSADEFEIIASFPTGKTAILEAAGIFLFDRVILMGINQTSTAAVIKFNELKCIDERDYRCKVSFLKKDTTSTSKESEITNISVRALPSKPDKLHWSIEPAKPVGSSRGKITLQSLTEGDNVTFTCIGNVGNPTGKFVWEIRTKKNEIINYTDVVTNIDETLELCTTHNGTSSLSIKITTNHNMSIIRCVEKSLISQDDMYLGTEKLNVYYRVKSTSITKRPDKTIYGLGSGNITLICSSSGNPEPSYIWWKDGKILSSNEIYVILHINHSSSGTYFCNTSNSFFKKIYREVKSVYVRIDETESRTDNPIQKQDESNNAVVGIIVGCCLGVTVIVVVAIIVYFRFRKNRNQNGQNKKEGNEREYSKDISPSNYDGIDENGITITKNVKLRNIISLEGNGSNNLEYSEEDVGHLTNILPNPRVEYAVVNKPTKKNEGLEYKKSKLYEEHYAESQEDVYDVSGNRRHKPVENAENYETVEIHVAKEI